LHLSHELSSHLVSQSYFFYSFPSQNIYVSGRLSMELFGKVLGLPRYYKWDVVKTGQASHGLTETHQKDHWKIMLYQRGGEKNTHTWDRWTCANGKEWSWGTKEVLVIGLHMVGKISLELLNLETLKFLMHFREPGVHFTLFLYRTYSYIFLFFSFMFFLSLY
jgi:hypothetical protein